MISKEIKIKLKLTSIKTYAGGKEQLLDDIKNAGIVIHNDSNGYYITSESETKYSASTDYAEKLNQLKTLTVLSPEEAEIASLNIAFINKDNDNPYAVPDNATIDGETINLTFNSYTLTFTNTEYPQFDIELPDAMIVPEGTSVVLPSVSGTFEDEEYTYTPSSWSIGEFGSKFILNNNINANLVWKSEEKQPSPPTSTLVPIYIQSGNRLYQSSVKNDTPKSDTYCYAIYSDENRTTPYVFDWGKRNVFGHLKNGEFVANGIQTQAQLPSTTGADAGYYLCVNKRSSPSTDGCLWQSWNTYQSGYNSYPTAYLMIYDDAMSAWLNSNHTDENPAGLNIVTDFDYDYSKTYKILAFVNANGIKVNDEQLHGISFSDNSGKIKITLSEWTSLIAPAARIVFYAEDKTVYTGYFNSGNGNAQKEAVVSWGPGGGQYEYVYPLNSDTAYQFNASATYTIISVFYTSGETVTNETLAPYSISGSVTMINDPGDSGKLMLKTKISNRIYGKPCGCTFTAE